MREISLDEFQLELRAAAPKIADVKFVCPMCEVPQSANDLIAAGAGVDFAAVEKFVGFSCIGRFTAAGAPNVVPDGNPCNCTLGGLFNTAKLSIRMPDGKVFYSFEIAKSQ